ncbi:vacuolar protein sorting-associated protein 54, chloroplastic [Nymphaea colorata]|nr:vacuolar protein sorting-associated protein 54, chloroplastic [Nymphaea colorata]
MERGPSQAGRSKGGVGVSREIADSIARAVDLPKGDSASYAGDHSLASILNNPHVGKSGVYGSDASWASWFSSGSANPTELPPIVLNKTFPEIARSDFSPYLASISEPYGRFEDIQHHTNRELLNSQRDAAGLDGSASVGDSDVVVRGQGESLVACLREVPSLFFKEDFALEDGGTFRAACPFSSISETGVLQEKLSHYLDIVELHLVKEISLRSDSFFEAQVQLQDLNSRIVESCGRLQELKSTIRLLDNDLVGSAKNVQELNKKRSNLLALQQKLRLILYVNQALSALKLLLASADCAGALDVTDDLQHLLDSDELTGLHCFRHLRDHLAMSLDSINSILAADFVRSAIHNGKDMDVGKPQEKGARPAAVGREEDLMLDEEESSGFRERLLPIIIGLLRTAKLPAVLRMYRETLIGNMKTAIKTTVASLLPVLAARPMDSDLQAGERPVDSDGGGLSLANKLRSLSPDNFVMLLTAIFNIVQAHLVMAAEVKKVIEWIMGGLDGSYAADSVAAAVALGAATAAAAEAAQENYQTDPHVPYSIQRSTTKVDLLPGRPNEASSASNVSKNFRADVLRENTEAIFAACDAAHGRWAKLLGVRAQLHPRLRLQEFLSIHNITQDFISATEKIGGRLGYSIRGTLQSQSKAFVDFQHVARMEKVTAVLDQETWVSVDVPEEFQTISNSFSSSGEIGRDDPTCDDASGPAVTTSTKVYISNEQQSKNVKQDVTLAKSVNGQDKALEISNISHHSDDRSTKEHGKTASQMLFYGGVGYHMVNCGLILLKMLSEYIDISKSLPALSSEVVHRIVEILKHFNTRTCQLVLGARAMQVSGLKSITAKHLALASQVISFFYALMPEMRCILFTKVPESRKALLSSELDRVAQDYKVHRDEIHAKLVQIMKERLLVHLRALPQIAENWNKTEDTDPQPSQFARALTKEVGVLQRVLSRTLLEEDVIEIFRQVTEIFHLQLTEAFSKLDLNTPQAKNRLFRDIQHILACIHALPAPKLSGESIPKPGKLDDFLAQRFQSEAGQ